MLYFGRKQTSKKEPNKIIKGFKVRKNVQLMFSRQKDPMKDKHYIFRDSNLRTEMLLGCI